MKAVILVGGYGTRLSEHTTRIPKPMVEIGGKPILWHIMKYYSSFGVNEFVLCLGYKGHVIKDYFMNLRAQVSDLEVDLDSGTAKFLSNGAEPWKITMINTGLDTGTGGRLSKIRQYVKDETFHMTYGDGLADVDLQKLVETHEAGDNLVTVTGILPVSRYGYLETFSNDSTQVESFREKPEVEEHVRINGGFFVIDDKALDYVTDESEMWEKGPMEKLVRDQQLGLHRHDGFWQCMDTQRDRNVLEDIWSKGEAAWKRWH